MNYSYFISYYFHKDNNTGFGNCNITSEKLINSMEDIKSVTNQMEKDFNMDKVIILNYKLLNTKLNIKE